MTSHTEVKANTNEGIYFTHNVKEAGRCVTLHWKSQNSAGVYMK